MKILVVDDSKTNLMMTAAYLEQLGHEPILTADPYQCAVLFETNKPDLVILDVVMEGMDGYACARAIRKINDAADDWVPIIFLSAMIDDKSIAQGIDAGGDDYLTKPFSEITLAAKIKAMQRIADMRKKLFDTSEELKEANEKLSLISLTDGLTGIFNRRAFDKTLAAEWQRASRLSGADSTVSLIMLDIDYFKKYNDHFGHQAGDDCLRKVAGALAKSLKRVGEKVFRYGGEEFAAILPSIGSEKAKIVAEDFRKNVLALKIKHTPESGRDFVSISLGVASLHAGLDVKPEDLIKRADLALYKAKEDGRNRIEVFTS